LTPWKGLGLQKTPDQVAFKALLRKIIPYLINGVKLIVAFNGILEMIMLNKRGCCLHCTCLMWRVSVSDV